MGLRERATGEDEETGQAEVKLKRKLKMEAKSMSRLAVFIVSVLEEIANSAGELILNEDMLALLCLVLDVYAVCQLLDSIVYGGRDKTLPSWERRRQFILLSEDVCECRASVTASSAAQIGLMHLRVQTTSFRITLRPITQFDPSCF